jgi:hypothetical protein
MNAYVEFQTSNIAIVRRKLAAARDLFGDTPEIHAEAVNPPIELYVSGNPLVTTTGQDIWCSNRPENVVRIGRRLVHLSEGKIDPAQQELPRWRIRLPDPIR